ncbi:DNA polymerase epsilon subunit 4 [Cephus cinctus]|uniref:DNA polymerase epsilon subunit 4 n=1 Tax=Cephus cinctus TaxID=211228 RepID=A0AAJ7FP46_CEPCN|nr:DNA polymerase epsilon subunit 4 [Cephus cinctus]
MTTPVIDDFTSENELNESAVSTAGENSQDSQEETENISHGDEEQKEKLVRLPLGRVRHIMKMDPDVNLVNQEAIFLITKSTELFIDSLAKEAYKYTVQTKKKTVQKRDVESAIENVDSLVFLEGTLE